MVLYNADGGRAEMSGNGMRCLAWVAIHTGLGDGKRLVVDTDGGRRTVDVEVDADGDVVATVDMVRSPSIRRRSRSAPQRVRSRSDLSGVTYDGGARGWEPTPRAVRRRPCCRVTSHGPRLEYDERFPKRTNVEFVTVSGPDELTMRVWERGVGETLSCGTGACAAAAVAHRRGLVGDTVTVKVAGGDLAVELGDTVRLGGPVVHVFDVDVEEP
jgi:diaminopimelate epimerase